MDNEKVINQLLLMEQKFKDIENQLSNLSNRVQTIESFNEHHISRQV